MNRLLILVVVFAGHLVVAQEQDRSSMFLDFDAAVGNLEGTLSASLSYDVGLGRNQKIIVGLGARLTGYIGQNRYYVTAPAELTSGSTGPGVLFKKNIGMNMDSFLINTSQVNALNLLISVGYNVNERLMLRFNIDAIGFSFGKKVRGNYINGNFGRMEEASPTTFNLLLISDNDLGSLNSVLFARYKLTEKLGVKAGAQFLFTEYTTDSQVQEFPESNDRFRKKSLMLNAGISIQL